MNDTPDTAMLDRTALDDLLDTVGGDPEFLEEIIDTFLEETPALISEMQTAAAAGDASTLRRASHTLKSNSRTFGARRLGDLCQQIEEIAATSVVDGTSQLVDMVSDLYPSVAEALRSESRAS